MDVSGTLYLRRCTPDRQPECTFVTLKQVRWHSLYCHVRRCRAAGDESARDRPLFWHDDQHPSAEVFTGKVIGRRGAVSHGDRLICHGRALLAARLRTFDWQIHEWWRGMADTRYAARYGQGWMHGVAA